ncbi:MAG: hypothetical protein FWG17_07325 [Desulfovibrionaceae bacterium]|nr:hypothetical protein [Desulfovibrionaceae bacterium]
MSPNALTAPCGATWGRKSNIAQDADAPLTSSSVLEIIAWQTCLPAGLIGLQAVLAGADAILAECLRLWEEGRRILICDAVTDENITAIAQALDDTPFPILAVDPGPFTAELALARLGAPDPDCAKGACPASRPDRVLAVIGSTSEWKSPGASWPAKNCASADSSFPAARLRLRYSTACAVKVSAYMAR